MSTRTSFPQTVIDLGEMTLEDYLVHHDEPMSLVTLHGSNVGVATQENRQLEVSLSLPCVGGLLDAPTCGQKRLCSDEKVERKHKRMIKNRESAARSRARRKAYTNELENKISRLEEENRRLKEEKQSSSPCVPTPPQETKYQLRRTSSASF
ncbi:hypothetical protein Sjap_012140 [Stephania japonica]|uniref:BZIP domain-containing protein n=1 Tax=Stephania japonica TaxID=461633 RepID=A0AAP0IX55_9MAGN